MRVANCASVRAVTMDLQSFLKLDTSKTFDLDLWTTRQVRETLRTASELARNAFASNPSTELFLRAVDAKLNVHCTHKANIDATFLCALHFLAVAEELRLLEGHPLHGDGANSAIGVRLQRYLVCFLSLASERAAKFAYFADNIRLLYEESRDALYTWRGHFFGALGVVRLGSAMRSLRLNIEQPPVELDQRGIDLIARGASVNVAFQVKATRNQPNHTFLFVASQSDDTTEDWSLRRLYGHSKRLARETGEVWTPVSASIGLDWRSDDIPDIWTKEDPSIAPAFLAALRNAPQPSSE